VTSTQTTPPISSLFAAIAAISVAGAGFGHSLPLLSILLEGYGASDTQIGLVSAVTAFGVIVGAPTFPRVIAILGLKPFLIACLGLMTVSYVAIYFAGDRLVLWYPLRFLFGVAGAGLFAASEIWITALAPDRVRGRIIGIYSTCLAFGFALGPLLIDLLGTEGFLPFAAAAMIFLGAAAPIALATAPPPDPPEATRGFFALLPKAPATFSSSAVFAALEAAMLTFLPILAIERGWGPEVGARAITVYGFGILALQFPIGLLSDRIGHVRSLILLSGAGLAGAVAFTAADSAVLPLYVVLFLWGGAIAGLYTVGLTLLGERFPAGQRSAANTGFVFAYGVGAIIGPAVAGVLRDHAGADGVNIFLICFMAAYATLAVARRRATLP
jgi:MFS family permease